MALVSLLCLLVGHRRAGARCRVRCGRCRTTLETCEQCGGEGTTQPGERNDCGLCGAVSVWDLCLGRCDDQGRHAAGGESTQRGRA
jgi:hypothetical protein